MGTCISGKDRSSSKNYYSTNGERFHHKILLIGKTGAGKSTAINMFVNLIYKKKYKDSRKIAITQKVKIDEQDVVLKCNMDEFDKKQSDSLALQSYESQTSKAFIYELKGKDYDISLIDTPGLGDTKGTKVDQENIRTIIAGIQQLSKITCILYIHSSTDIKDVLYVKYYINQLKDLLPEKYKDNIVIGFTSSQNPQKIEAISVLKKSGIPVGKYVCFENDCLMHPDSIPKTSYSQNYENISKSCWKQNTQQFQKLIEMIMPMKNQDTEILLDLFCKKQAFVQIIYQKQHKIEENQQMKGLFNSIILNIIDVKQALERSTNQSSIRPVWRTMKKSKQIKKFIDVELKEKVTFCFNCCSICHDPCQLQEIYNKGDVKIKQCYAFGCGSHDVCNKCSHAPESHGHSIKIQQVKDVAETFDFEYLEQQLPSGISQTVINNEITQAISQLTKKEENMLAQLKEKEKDIENGTVFIAAIVKQIKEQSINFNNQIIIEYIEGQIQKTKQDDKLDNNEKNYLMKMHNEQLEYYQKLEKEIQNAQNFNFAKYNQPQLEREATQLLDEQAKIIKKRDFS